MDETLLPSSPEDINPLLPQKKERKTDLFDMSFEQREAMANGGEATANKNLTANVMGAAVSGAPVGPVSQMTNEDVGSAAVQEKANTQRAQRLSTGLESIAKSDLPIETKRTLALNLYTSESTPAKSAESEFMKAMSYQGVFEAQADNVTVQDFLERNSQYIADRYEERNNALKGAFLDTMPDAASLKVAYDLVESAALPFTYSYPVTNVIQEVMPDGQTSFLDLLFSGSKQQEFRDILHELPVERQIDMLKRISDSINNSTDNVIIKQQMASMLLNIDKMSDTEAMLDNLFSAMDFVVAGTMARSTYRAGKALVKGSAKEMFSKANIKKAVDRFFGRDPLQIKPSEKSVFNQVSQTSPDTAERLAIEAIQDPTEQIAKALGVDRASLSFETQLPKPGNMPATPTVAVLPEKLTPLDSGHLIINYSEAERAGVKAHIEQGARVLSNQYGLTPNNVFFNTMGDSLEGIFHITKNETAGFSRLAEAKALQDKILDSLSKFSFANKKQQVEIYMRDLATNEFVPMNKTQFASPYDKMHGIGEFRVVLRLEEEYNSSHALAEEIVRPGKVSGLLTRWFDKSAWMKDWANLATNQAFERMSGRLKELRMILKPLSQMSISTQRKVHHLLDTGDQEAKWHSLDDIKNIFGQDPDFDNIVKGYLAVRKHQDKVYSLINWATRNKLVGKGYKELSRPKDLPSDILDGGLAVARRVSSTELNDIINPITIRQFDNESNPSVARIYDIDEDRFRTITRDDVVRLNDGESEVYKSLRPLRQKGDRDEIDYIIRKTQESNAKVAELPEFVLHHRDGYISRMYDAGYLVTVSYRTRKNGITEVVKQKVVGLENNKRSAQLLRNEIIERQVSKDFSELMARGPLNGEDFNNPDVINAYKEQFRNRAAADININYSHEFNLSPDGKYYDPTSLDYVMDTGQLYTSPRNPVELTGSIEELVTSNGTIRTPRRLVSTVQEAIETAQLHAAKAGTLDLTLEKLVENWKKSYGEMFKSVTGGEFPWARNKLSQPERMSIEDKQKFDNAVAMAEYIKNIAGLNEPRIKVATRTMMIRMAEGLLEGTPRHWKTRVAEGLFKNRNLNIIDKAKATAFFQLITMRPLRQAILQANQASLYLNRGDYGKYFMKGDGAKEFAGIWMGMLAKSLGNFDTQGKRIADALGYDFDEFAKTIDAYVLTGLPASIESHMFVAHSTLDRNLQRFVGDLSKSKLAESAEYAKHYGNVAHKWIRRMGFDLGEQTQLLGAFLAEKHAWQVANPTKAAKWMDADALTEIAGKARSLSGNMNEAGTLQFQRGLLGLASQFMSHATKMMQLLAPRKAFGYEIPGLSKIASEAISDSEKYRMMLTQLFMYGSSGLGLTTGYEKFRDDFMSEFGVEVPQDVSMIVEEGLFGSILNMGIRLARGEEPFSTGVRQPGTTDFEISKSLAPVAAAPFWTNNNPFGVVFGYLLDTKPEAWQLLGPGFEVFKRMVGTVPTLAHILGDASYLDTGDRMKAALIQAASGLVLEADNWQRVRYQMAVGRYLSRSGNKGVSAEELEVLTNAAFGVRSRLSREVTEFNLAVEGVYGGYFKEPDVSNSQISKMAKKDFEHVRRVFELLNVGDVEKEEMERSFQHMAEFSHIVLDERERALYQQGLWKSYREWVKKDTPENQLIKNMIRISKQAESDPMEQAYYRILNMDNFENKEVFVNGLRDLMN